MNELVKELSGKYSREHLLLINIPNIKVSLEGSTAKRIVFNGQIIRYNYLFNKINTITTVFKVTRDKTSAIYAFLFSEVNENKIDHKFVSTGPTFTSMDGEYRHKTIPMEKIYEIFEYYEKQLNIVEDLILEKLNNNEIEFRVEFFYPEEIDLDRRDFEESINTLRLSIKFYILCWTYDFHQIHNKVMENHINPAYQYIIYESKDIPVYEYLVNSFPNLPYEKKNSYEEMIYTFSKYGDISAIKRGVVYPETGQKIIPVTFNEASNPGDINFDIWRELWIMINITNLIINFISPSFSMFNNWFYVQNSNSGLYDNYSIYMKYKHSEISEAIHKQLIELDKINYVNEDPSIGPISGKFLRMSGKIKKSINYLESSIRLTNLSIALHMEHVGRTLRDIPTLVKNNKLTPGFDKFFNTYESFCKHLFEYIYAFYCINTKLEIMHGDLHLNNATIFMLYNLFTNTTQLFDNPLIVYKLVDDLFVFPHYGLYSVLIDFSRGITNNKVLLEKDFGKVYADRFYHEQKNRVVRMLNNYLPNFMEKYSDELISLILRDFPLVFKILTAIDSYAICRGIYTMFEVEFKETLKGEKELKIPKASKQLLKQIETYSLTYIIKQLTLAIKGEIKCDDIEYPNLEILRKYFSNFIIKDAKDIKGYVLDAFNSNNDIKYGIQKYENYPYMLKIEPILELRKKYGIQKDVKEYKQVLEVLKEMHVMAINDDDISALSDKFTASRTPIIEDRSWMFE